MKIFSTLPLFFTLISTTISAQKLEVKYQEITHIDEEALKVSIQSNSKSKKLPDNFKENMLKNLTDPKDYLLTIYDNQSYYKKEEKISNSQSGGSSFSISFSGVGNGLFKDISENEYLTSVSMFNKEYTIKDQLTDYQWKLSRETKKILGFDVKKATSTTDTGNTVTAWYAPSIPVKNGPAMYSGLPGLILEVQTTNSKSKLKENTSIKAIEVKEDPSLKPIQKPKEKNVITDKEFKNISEIQFKQFKQMNSEGVDRKD